VTGREPLRVFADQLGPHVHATPEHADHDSSGLGPDRPLDVHHNLISGAYPESAHALGADYTGGGILVADSGGSHLTVRGNRVVSTTNYGAGDPDETGQMTGVDAHDNVVGWLRGSDLTRNDTPR